MKSVPIVIITVLLLISTSAYAELHDRGGGLIYDDVLNVTWLQDANYAETSGYDDDGRMNWDQAVYWADQLEYGGYDDWRLPVNLPVNGVTYDYNYSPDGTTDYGDNITNRSSEMSYLFHVTLRNLSHTAPDGSSPQPGWSPGVLSNGPGPFINIMVHYPAGTSSWSGTEYGADLSNSWLFSFNSGRQSYDLKEVSHYQAWAVRDGDVIPHTHCVSTSAELQDALNVAATNSTPDIIRIRGSVTPYVGNFVYTSTEPFGLTIEGKYNSDCSERVVGPPTVLDGDNTGRVLTLDCSVVAADLVVDGITIQNGSLISGRGSGIFVATNQGNALIKNSTIKNNTGAGSGGGAYFSGNETLNLINNQVAENRGGHSGGVFACATHSMTIIGNTFVNNYASGDAGGVSIGPDACVSKPELVTFSHNVVSNNKSDSNWGGILIKGNGATITVHNNTITHNSAIDGGGGKIVGGGGFSPPGVVLFTNNIVSENFGIEGSGGIRISGDKEVSVKDNFIIENRAGSRYGHGGITVSGTQTVTIANNIINNNSGQSAPGGVHIDFPSISSESVLTVINNTICQNTSADYGGGIKIDLENEAQSANVYNNIIWANSATLGSDIYIKNDGNNNGTPSPVNLFNNDFDLSNGFFIQIDDDSVVYSDNLNNEDPLFDIDGYHLTKDSPCIDEGVDAGVYDDIDGDSRPQGDGYDIGADEYVTSDSDGDGIPDDDDACTDSDLNATVVIDGCDSGVDNVLLEDGCTISDLISQCAEDVDNHGEFVSSVSHTANSLKKEGIISGGEKGKIQKCAAKADIP